MPNPILADKYKGKPFGEVSKDIESKYQDRFDPISQRGLMAEMGVLREQQELKREKQLIKEQLKQQLEQQTQMEQQMAENPELAQQMEQAQIPGNEGVQVNPVQQPDQGNFAHAASQSYNQEFALGGLLRYAPVLGNIAGIALARKPQGTLDRLQGLGYNAQVDEGLATRVQPRQTQFNNIDMSHVERGIQDQARGFSASNLNASGGNSGQFMANELASQGNVMNAIGNARIQQQQSDRQTRQLNAGEQARIDNFGQQQSAMQAGIQGQNMQMGLNVANMDEANQGAYNNFRLSNIMGLTENVGNIAREDQLMKSIIAGLNYNMAGDYSADGKIPNDIPEWLKNIFKSRGR